MLKLMRQKTIENPRFFRGIMLILAVTFMVSLGWWGGGGADGDKRRNIAEIDEDAISLDEHTRAYQNAVRFYRQMKVPFKEEVLRKQILDQIVEQKLWLHEAVRMDLQVTNNELMESILTLPGFHENGQFNQERYRRILSLEKLTPEKFEQRQREEMLIEKAKGIVWDSAALTPSDMDGLEKSPTDDIAKEENNRLNKKKEKVIRAYTLALKKKAAVSIHDEAL
jgi:peptidyl-prolyl cis-trans isomerase D